MRDFYVFKSPEDGHGAVAQMAGSKGWPVLYGPDTFEGCWAWIRANCKGGPNYYIC